MILILGFGMILGVDQSLKVLFPELFRIARNKEAWVKDNILISNGAIHWSVPFFRAV
jgi:hypothetical protein